MQLNRNGYLARFYLFFEDGGKDLPQDFCSYFWGLVGRVVFVLGFGGTMIVGLIYGLVRFLIFITYLTLSHKKETLAVLAVIGLTALAIWLSSRKKKIKIEILSEVEKIIKGKIDAVKNRYCPRIDWKSE